MNDPLGMRRGQRIGELPAQLEHLRQGQPTVHAAQPRVQRLSDEELHHEIRRAVRKLTKIRDLHHSGMADTIHRTGFVREAFTVEKTHQIFPTGALRRRKQESFGSSLPDQAPSAKNTPPLV